MKMMIRSLHIKSDDITNSYPEKNNFKMGIEHYPNDHALIAFDLTYIMHEGVDTTITKITTTEYDNIGSAPPVIVDIETTTIENEEGEDLNYGFGYFIDHKKKIKVFQLNLIMMIIMIKK